MGADLFDPEADTSGAMTGAGESAHDIDALRDQNGNLPRDVFTRLRAKQPAKRGPGRPAGSRNKRSAELERIIPHKYGDPVEFQAKLYSMPLDQMCELLLVADGTVARREELEELLVALSEKVDNAAMRQGTVLTAEDFRNLTNACDALASAASKMQGKPGDLAIKALNLQLGAAKAVSEYVHSKKAVEAKLTFDNLPVIAMPGATTGVADFQQQAQVAQVAGDLLAKALNKGHLEATDLVDLQLVDGRFVRGDVDVTPPDDDGADEAEGGDA